MWCQMQGTVLRTDIFQLNKGYFTLQMGWTECCEDSFLQTWVDTVRSLTWDDIRDGKVVDKWSSCSHQPWWRWVHNGVCHKSSTGTKVYPVSRVFFRNDSKPSLFYAFHCGRNDLWKHMGHEICLFMTMRIVMNDLHVIQKLPECKLYMQTVGCSYVEALPYLSVFQVMSSILTGGFCIIT